MPSNLECVQTYLRRQARRGRIAQALTAFTVYTPATDDAADAPYAIPRRLRRTVRDADLDELHAIFGRQSARPRVEFLAEPLSRSARAPGVGGISGDAATVRVARAPT